MRRIEKQLHKKNSHVQNNTTKNIRSKQKECSEDVFFAEDFAECIKFLLLKKSRLTLFENKAEFINTII